MCCKECKCNGALDGFDNFCTICTAENEKTEVACLQYVKDTQHSFDVACKANAEHMQKASAKNARKVKRKWLKWLNENMKI